MWGGGGSLLWVCPAAYGLVAWCLYATARSCLACLLLPQGCVCCEPGGRASRAEIWPSSTRRRIPQPYVVHGRLSVVQPFLRERLCSKTNRHVFHPRQGLREAPAGTHVRKPAPGAHRNSGRCDSHEARGERAQGAASQCSVHPLNDYLRDQRRVQKTTDNVSSRFVGSPHHTSARTR